MFFIKQLRAKPNTESSDFGQKLKPKIELETSLNKPMQDLVNCINIYNRWLNAATKNTLINRIIGELSDLTVENGHIKRHEYCTAEELKLPKPEEMNVMTLARVKGIWQGIIPQLKRKSLCSDDTLSKR